MNDLFSSSRQHCKYPKILMYIIYTKKSCEQRLFWLEIPVVMIENNYNFSNLLLSDSF